MNNDGYYDEESDDPSLESLTDDIPMYYNSIYHIKIKFRPSYSGESILFRPYVSYELYSIGEC